jgi:hypothetical protein
MNGPGALARINRGDLSAHRVTVPGVQDEIYSPLYDSIVSPTAGALQFNFFSLPIGQGQSSAPGAGAGATKTEADTNLSNSGLLPKGNQFYCTGIEFNLLPYALPGNTGVLATTGQFLNDIYTVSRNGWFRFRIQNRDYALDAPIGVAPPLNRLAVSSTPASVVTATTIVQADYASFAGSPYNIVPVWIPENTAFSVQVNFPALVPITASTTAAPTRFTCRLRGRLVRDAQ